MTLLPRPIVRSALRVVSPGAATLVLEGVFREPNAEEWFCPLVDDVHRRAVTEDYPEVVLDLSNLEYANASAWKCFVYWLRKLRADERAHYNLRIRTNQRHRWQRIGMPSLIVFGQDRLIIENHAGGELR